MVVTGPENIFYLTGQQTPGYYTFQALVLPVDGEPAFVVRQLEYFNFIANTFISSAAGLSGQRPAGRIPGRMCSTQRGWARSASPSTSAAGSCRSPSTRRLREQARRDPRCGGHRRAVAHRQVAGRARKDRDRGDLCRCRHARRARRGQARRQRERSRRAMMGAAIAAGSEYVGMEPLVSVGRRSGVPHGTWRRGRIAANEPGVSRNGGVPRPLPCSADALRVARQCAAGRDRHGDGRARMARRPRCEAIRPGAPCEAPHLACQARHRSRRLHREFQEARRLQHRHLLCAGLGRGRHPRASTPASPRSCGPA